MDNDEFNHWAALEMIEPIADPWVLNAINCQTIANVNRSTRKPYEWSMWMPVKKKKEMNEAQLKASFAKYMQVSKS